MTEESRKENIAKVQEFLQMHWGDLSEETFEQQAPRYFGDFENFVALGDLVMMAVIDHRENDAPLKPLGSLLLAALKAAYDLGRESATQ